VQTRLGILQVNQIHKGDTMPTTLNALKISLLLLFLTFMLALSGCRATDGSAGVVWGDADPSPGNDRDISYGPAAGKGPPAHAPAHGYRKKFQYRYYPSAQVYFDIDRRLYFYYEGGRWSASASLPGSIRVSLGESVHVELETDRPYERHDEVRSQYPPGKKGKAPKKK
jgi:hypothetical protein